MPSIIYNIDDLILESTLVARNPSIEDILREGKQNKLGLKPDKEILNKFSNIDEIPEQKEFFISRVLDQTIKEFKITQIPLAYFLVLVIVIINTICMYVFMIYLKSVYPEKSDEELSMISLGLTATFIAPITEEIHKRLSAKFKMSASSFIVFQIVETVQYLASGASLLFRIPAIMMHAVNTFMHQHGETTKKDVKPAKFTFITPIIIHAMWNGLASSPVLHYFITNYDMSKINLNKFKQMFTSYVKNTDYIDTTVDTHNEIFHNIRDQLNV
jgi:hypothetical protein